MKKKASYRHRRFKTNTNQSWFFLGLIAVSTWVMWKHEQFVPSGVVVDAWNLLKSNVPNDLATSFTQPKEVIAGKDEVIKSLDDRKLDSDASSLTYNGASVSELAQKLSQIASTDAQKARAIYDWITNQIAYDVEMFYSGQYRFVKPEEVLKTRKAICSGYAILYQALAKEMGLEAQIIPGTAKGVSYAVGQNDENHAWNAVKIDNGWYLVDATWGAGIIQDRQFKRQFNPHYFATPPKQFIYDHFPSNPSWQLLQTRYTKQQFEALPEVKPQFFRDGLQMVSHSTYNIQAQGTTQVVLQAPLDTIVSARLESESGLLDPSYTLVQREQKKIIVNAAFSQTGIYELKVFSKKKDEAGLYHEAITYKVLAQGQGKEFPKTYSHFSQNNAYLSTPLKKTIATSEPVYFQINVPNALKVVVIEQSSQNWTNLKQQGTMFTGTVNVNSGKVAIAAQFAQGEQYWTLVEYN